MPFYSITTHGVTYAIRTEGDSPSVDRVLARGVPYEVHMLDHIRRQRYTGTALDVGANIGNHSLYFALVCDLDVMAFEPVFHVQLQENLELNHVNRVAVHAAGLGAKRGHAEHVGPHGRLEPGEGGHPIQRLDDLAVPAISMMKVDVEGMEADVLKGATGLLVRDRPDVYAEEWDDSTRWHDGIAAVLEPLGYRMIKRFDSPQAGTPVGVWRVT